MGCDQGPLTRGCLRVFRFVGLSIILQTKKDIEFYLDFETINGCFYEDGNNMNLRNTRQLNGLIFMIGVGYIENNIWKYKSFYINTFSQQEERKIITEF